MTQTIFMHPFVQALGWALVHFIWQGALIALLVAMVLLVMRGFSSRARYTVATIGLLLMFTAPVVTVSRIYSRLPAGDSTSAQTDAADVLKRAQGPQDSLPKGVKVSLSEGAEAAERPAGFGTWESLTESRLATLARVFVLFWLAGILLLSVRLFSGWSATQNLKRRGLGKVTDACEESFMHLMRRMKVSRPVRLYKSVLVEVPTVIGWMRPVILVPVGAFVGLSQQQLDTLLAHELAHIRRYDYLVNLLQAAAETLLFYHPAVWWLSKRIRIEREHACDDMAVEACGDALVYARALAELEGLRATDGQGLALAATGGGSLVKRIRRLVSAPIVQDERRPAWLAVLILFVTISGAFTLTQGALFRMTGKDGLAPATYSNKREVAVTFVSLPYFRGGDETIESLNEMNDRLLKGLKDNNITAVGFVGAGALNKEGQRDARIQILRKWLDAGHELGNQGFQHLSLYRTPLPEYETNVLLGERVTRSLMQERGRQLRYYSYPFLNTGPNLETKRAFEQFLAEHGYTAHKITIDNMDWIFSNAYLEARKRSERDVMARISDEYIVYMERVFAHYEQLSMKVFGREIPQVLMLSASALNADNFDRLMEMLKKRGYSFATLEEAMKDKAFSQTENYTGQWGISWIERWALVKGIDIKGDPVLPEYMLQFGKQGLNKPAKTQ